MIFGLLLAPLLLIFIILFAAFLSGYFFRKENRE